MLFPAAIFSCTRGPVSGQYGVTNRVLNRLFDQLADVRGVTDRQLLDRFLTTRDEPAFAELVRRYGPVVWGACRRRLANAQDAEDAFQATFLVLLRRAAHVTGDAPLGPWLYRVAVMTARNVSRGNRRRATVAGPMEHDVPARGPEPPLEGLDLDAALLALPERDRAPVVLCHLQGLTRRAAAARLGCPEGTLSARLNRALGRLRALLGAAAPAVLAAGAVAVPTPLASATVRSMAVYSTSALTAAGVSPVVLGLTDGVLRMFWMKKVMTVAVVAALVLGAGVLALGTTNRSGGAARATEPLPASAPPAPTEEPDALQRLEKRLADLEKQKQLLDATVEDMRAKKRKRDAARKANDEAAELGSDLEVVAHHIVEDGEVPPYAVREVINGKVREVQCSDLEVLTKYLKRTCDDPKGPKGLRVTAYFDPEHERMKRLLVACATAGYKKAAFTSITSSLQLIQLPQGYWEDTVRTPSPTTKKTTQIDLTEYAPKRP